MAKRGGGGGGEAIPLSRFGVLVAQLESIVASAAQQPPDALLCFDLLSELSGALTEESKESIQLWQRKCEDVLFSLLILGARRPVRRLASSAMGRVIEKGDAISIYSRASTLQGWLVDGKRNEPMACAGAAQCLGELYRLFGRKITAGLVETANIVAKLMKFHEEFVRQDALLLLENALEGSGGTGASTAYLEAFRIIMRIGVIDKSFIVRVAAARCLKAFGSIGGPGLGITELDTSMSYCVKGLEDHVLSVRDAFAEALGALLAVAMNPNAQIKMGGKKQSLPKKKFDDGLQKHLLLPFIKASGVNAKKLRIGLALSWVFFLQMIHLKYRIPDNELQSYALQAMEILRGNGSPDPHALACVLYVLRIGVADQMTEPTQREFLVLLGKKLESSDYSPSMRVATLRMLSYLLRSLGQVPAEFKDVLDNTVVAALSHSSGHVRVEAALTVRALAEVDPTCVGGLISFGTTTLHALRENVSFDKGHNISVDLDSLHGQATVLAALVAISPKLLLGYPARLPKSVFEVSKKMLNEFSQNPMAATIEREAGWLLLAALISSMPKEELEDQVFDILILWAGPFTGNPESYLRNIKDWASELRVLSVAMEALMAFIRSFVSPTTAAANAGILLNPVLAYLGGALLLISSLCSKPASNVKPALDLFTTRTLMAYRSISNPIAYKSEHAQIIQICSSPFSDSFGWEESSCLRFLLDKRDACLGPWVPGRDSFEDELRAFDGGSDGPLPCVWDNEISSFPQSESVSKMLVNQMLLCFGTTFACQDNAGKIKLLNKIDQCLKSGKKQPWFTSCITNACVALLSGLKDMITLRPPTLSTEVLSMLQSIFQGILVETDISTSQRRAACECLGLLPRVSSDIFTARMTRSLLGELATAVDPNYIASIALSLGCIHHGAGGMALSTLVPPTVSALSLLSKNSNAIVQLWSLHALLLTIEAAGLSYISQVQGTLFLAMEILLLEENGYAHVRQEIGNLINAIVAVLGPELAPGSQFFSRSKSVIAEISSSKETATLLESVRFTQQLVLFAPQAVPVHCHVQGLTPTLYSRQPSLRYLAVSTLRHLIERDPAAMINENIEENLFIMLDEETDSDITSLVRATIIRLLYASCPLRPSRWLTILRTMVLATSIPRDAGEDLSNSGNDDINGMAENDISYGQDDDGMIAGSKGEQLHGPASTASQFPQRNKHLRYRTRIFAAECLSYVPTAVGTDPAHFDLSLARSPITNGSGSLNDWLVLRLQELVSLSYQISTGQFEGMQPIGVRLLSVIMDKFGKTSDPDFPGHILLEQFQAQLVSAVRTAISTASGPLLLEAGLELATKVMTSSVIGGDRVALNRLFMLISRPLDDIQDLCYPSFADWVVCKIKVRLLTAHASVKCYTYQLLKSSDNVPDEYQQLAPLLANSSILLGKYWIGALKDYSYVCFGLHSKINYKPFLDGIQSSLVSSKVQKYLDEAWPVILQATALDAAPVEFERNDAEYLHEGTFISGRSMVKLDKNEFQFLWGLSSFILFHAQHVAMDSPVKIHHGHKMEQKFGNFFLHGVTDTLSGDVILTVFLSLTREVFFSLDFLSVNICQELLQALLYANDCSSALVLSLFSQVLRLCPENFFEVEGFVFSAMELCSRYLSMMLQSNDENLFDHSSNTLISDLSIVTETMARRMKNKQYFWKLATALISTSYQSFQQVSTNLCFSKVVSFLQNILPLLKEFFKGDESNMDLASGQSVLGALASLFASFSAECIKRISILENKVSESYKLFAKILFFCLGETIALAKIVYETAQLHEKGENDVLYGIFGNCIRTMQDSVHSTNTQVQTLGILVLKTFAQRELTEGSHIKSHSFVLLVGELLEDIFSLIQNTMKNCSSMESVMVVDECLKLLFLFHTIAQEKRQQAVTNLLLEALLMVFIQSKDGHSQELIEANTIAKKLVSHLVQIPSAAIQLKEIMLSASVTQRQRLQDMIRASVGQVQNVMPVNLNAPAEKNAKESSINTDSDAAQSNPDDTYEKEEEDDDNGNDDDDWDAFQSLPANLDKDDIGSAAIAASPADNSIETPHQEETKYEYRSSEEISDAKDSEGGTVQGRSPSNNEQEMSVSKTPDSEQVQECDKKVQECPEPSQEDKEIAMPKAANDFVEPSVLWQKDEGIEEKEGSPGDEFAESSSHIGSPMTNSITSVGKDNEAKSSEQVLLEEAKEESKANEDFSVEIH